MLGYMLYFSIVLGLFVIGDWLGIWTKAKLSSIFVVLISLDVYKRQRHGGVDGVEERGRRGIA